MWLDKWYADRVEAGQVHIDYRANLRLGPVTLGYRRRLGAGGRDAGRLVLGGVAVPRVEAGRLDWPSDGAAPALTWHGATSRPHLLYRDAAGSLVWNPLVLNGRVGVAGRGYGERLSLALAPWRLGLARLSWGRFCGARHSLVWIEWRGATPLRLALLDGTAAALLDHDRNGVAVAGARLALATPTEIVNAALDAGPLGTVACLAPPALRHFLRGVEVKWWAPARLDLADGGVDRGHALWEEVTWP